MTTRTVTVALGERAYPILIGEGLLGIRPPVEASRWLLVSDSVVDPLYGAPVAAAIAATGAAVGRVVVPAGEDSKCQAQLGRIYGAACEAGLDRRSCIAALGGGVVGDLAGFAAGTFLRGIRYVQLPTTLLAMVDSSVGGKTAINLPQGKNLVGAFHQPVAVVADLATLATLPAREFRSGLSEVIKYGVIRDAALFGRLESGLPALAVRQPDSVAGVVARCCEIKAEVVGADEREGGLRSILNFGHTLGHALEAVDGYGRWLHGEAVAIGMAYAALVSVRARGLAPGAFRALAGLLAAAGLPVADGDGRDGRAGRWKLLRAAMSADKKSLDSRPRLVLAEAIGRVAYGCEVDEAELERAYVDLPSACVGGT